VRRNDFNKLKKAATNKRVSKEGGNDNSQKPSPCAKTAFDVHQARKLL
jgi:hypothetical protein